MRLRLLLISPLLLLLVVFALSNTAPVAVGLWPTGVSLTLPLCVAILSAMAAAFLLGALTVWFSALAQRRRARRAEARVARLETELATRTLPPALPLRP